MFLFSPRNWIMDAISTFEANDIYLMYSSQNVSPMLIKTNNLLKNVKLCKSHVNYHILNKSFTEESLAKRDVLVILKQ